MNRRGRSVVITSVMLFAFACVSAANDHPSEGDQWLGWSDETRVAYVYGFLWGFERGFFDGCTVGEKTYAARETGLPGQKCISKIPNKLKTPEQYAEIVTNYYRSYPTDRNVAVRSLLDGLQRDPDLTIEQIHKTYPSTAKTTHEAR